MRSPLALIAVRSIPVVQYAILNPADSPHRLLARVIVPLRHFLVGVGLRWGPIEVRYSHACYHPVTPFASYMYLNGEAIPIPKAEGGIDDFSISFSGKIGGKP